MLYGGKDIVDIITKSVMYGSFSGRPNTGKSTIVQAICARTVANVKRRQRLLPVLTFSKTGVPNSHYISCMKALYRVYMQPVAARAWTSTVLPAERLVFGSGVSTAVDALRNDAVVRTARSVALSVSYHGGELLRQEERGAKTLLSSLTRSEKQEFEKYREQNDDLPHFLAAQIFCITRSSDVELSQLALMGDCVLSALIETSASFSAALMDVAYIVHEYSGAMVSVRTENMPLYHGARFCAQEARRNEFEAVFPGTAGRTVRWVARSHPIDLIKASMLVAVVHVGTLDNRFEAEMDAASTMSGGMSQAILLAGQDVSDTATYVGGCVYTEIRDDYTKSRTDELSNMMTVTKVDDTISRFMGTSEVALHITERGSGILRRRSFTMDGADFTSEVSWTLDEIKQAKDVTKHLLAEPNDYLSAAVAAKVDYAAIEALHAPGKNKGRR
jgi:hypothetical protein